MIYLNNLLEKSALNYTVNSITNYPYEIPPTDGIGAKMIQDCRPAQGAGQATVAALPKDEWAP